ncbi:conserved domain protein [Verrucomicrobiia bacterium DG1235]|nr:conserved domain protein [Verrucomicrobiae bacterium DG1235]
MPTNLITPILATTLILLASTITACHAQDTPNDWPKGIDPSTLLLNTEPEPDLSQPGFVNLFNGRDLTGWTVKGAQMPYHVDNGEIVGTCIPDLSPNAFLCTDQTYDNFIFTTEFKWDVYGNSGIMFRADTQPADANGVERVFGYQSEMEATDRAWTGGIYGEVMGGWKFPLSREAGHAAARAALKGPDVWNRMTIYASGNTIRTWVNGVPCAFLVDDDRSSGFFGLQVHSGPEGTVRWRNIKVKSIPAETTWTDLFQSGDFSQWTKVNGSPVSEKWSIEDGIITRRGLKPGDIVTKTHYQNFELLFDWKITEAGNSGLKYRTRGSLGLEYQILDDAKHSDREDPTHRTAALYDLKRPAHDKPIRPVGEWNNARILVQGDQITHYLNGQPVVEIQYGSEEWQTAFAKSKYSQHEGFGSWTGPILLQDHADQVSFRNLLIRPL